MILEKNKSLKKLNTFGIDVFAEYYAECHTVKDIQEVLQHEIFQKHTHLILGGGSNILFTKNVEGLVLKIQLKGKEIVAENTEEVVLKIAAGEGWNDFVQWSLEHAFYGLENLSLIPGCVGAAPMQNIGAYGVEMKDSFLKLDAINIETGNIETFDKASCELAYRESIFKRVAKNKYIITHVYFTLKKQSNLHISYGAIQQKIEEFGILNPTPKDIAKAVIAIRESKLPNPAVIGNAGSFFKNPVIPKIQFEKLAIQYPNIPNYPDNENVKVPAGWLIEQCGWKGYREGDAGCHKDQALVLVNYGNATGMEIISLAKKIQQSVKEKFDIEIEMEVNIY